MNSALILLDMQKAIDDPFWSKDGPRNHPNAELTALRLIEAWRIAGQPIYHVRHDSVDPQSTYRPGQPGNEFKPGFEPRGGEALIVKRTGSAFTGTGLEAALRQRGLTKLVVAGVITNNSVESTVRHAGTLGFEVTLVEDACFTFARRDWYGRLCSAAEVHAMSLANLAGEYCRVSTSAEVLAELGSPLPILPSFEGPPRYLDWDERSPAAAEHIAHMIEAACPGARTEHIGSTAVPGCAGKGVIDLLVTYPPGALETTRAGLHSLGFQRQTGRDPFPENRPMRIGAIAHGGRLWRIHAHVVSADADEAAELCWFRDRLRSDASLREAYMAEKRAILARGIRDGLDYALAKTGFIRQELDRRAAPPP
jgi:nicotinamidase-related amidase/GrpB-like predicted nucleotidyltransferase (UPF0157 family)